MRYAYGIPVSETWSGSLWPMQSETEKSENLFLYIDLPRFDFPVIFSETVSNRVNTLLSKG